MSDARPLLGWWEKLRPLEKIAIGALLIYSAMQLLAPFYVPVDGHDSPVHLAWIDGFAAQFRQGVWYPRWLPASFSGFGAPTFYFYPPLGYFAASVLRSVLPALSTVALFNLLGSASTILSFVGCRKLLRRLAVTSPAASIGALIYAFAPYRFFDLYIRGAFGEHLALAIFPFLFLAAETLVQAHAHRFKGFAILGILWAALLMTNIPSAALGGLTLPLYLLIRTPKKNWPTLIWPALALMLGTLCAAIYLFPVLAFSTYLNPSLLGGQIKDFSTGNAILDLILGKNLMSNRIYCSLMLCAAVLFLSKKQSQSLPGNIKPDYVLRGFQTLLALALLLQLPYITLPLFTHLLPVSMIQFTWRWDVIVVLASAVIVAILWDADKRKWPLLLLILWSVAGSVLLPFTAAGVHMHYLPSREIVEPGEYLPLATADRINSEVLNSHRSDPFIVSGDSSIKIISDDSNALLRRIQIQTQKPTQATLHLFTWPQWRITSDGVQLPISSDSIGRITTVVPAGTHLLTISLADSAAEALGRIVSIVAFILLILIAWLGARFKQSNAKG